MLIIDVLLGSQFSPCCNAYVMLWYVVFDLLWYASLDLSTSQTLIKAPKKKKKKKKEAKKAFLDK